MRSGDNGRSFRGVRAVIWAAGDTVMSGQISKIRVFWGCAAWPTTKLNVRMCEIVNKELSTRTMSVILRPSLLTKSPKRNVQR